MHQLIVTKREVADILGLSERRITELVKTGVLPARGWTGFDLVVCVRAYVAFLNGTFTISFHDPDRKALRVAQ